MNSVDGSLHSECRGRRHKNTSNLSAVLYFSIRCSYRSYAGKYDAVTELYDANVFDSSSVRSVREAYLHANAPVYGRLQHSSTLWDSVDYVKEHAGFAGQYHNSCAHGAYSCNDYFGSQIQAVQDMFFTRFKEGLTHVLNYA